MQTLKQQFKNYLLGKPVLITPITVTQTTKLLADKLAQSPSAKPSPASSSLNSTKPIPVILPNPSLSSSSIRNYLADINHFFTWLSESIQETVIEPQHITTTVINDYRLYLSENLASANLNTSNRRLSTLRKFGLFLYLAKLTDINPCQKLTNLDTISDSNLNQPTTTTLSHILAQFEDDLKAEKLTNSTIKNYLSDVKQYLSFTQTNSKTTNSKANSLS